MSQSICYIQIYYKLFFILFMNNHSNLPNQQFTIKTRAYELDVSLHSQKLRIRLKQKPDQNIYQREYTHADVGNEINQKMALQDIFYTLYQYSCYCNQNKDISYKFGDMMYYNDLPYFKIEKGGKVTVYLTITNEVNNSVTYGSSLFLNKVNRASQRELNNIKVEQRIDKLKAKSSIPIIQQKNEMKKKVQELQEENRRLSRGLQTKNQELAFQRESLAKAQAEFDKLKEQNNINIKPEISQYDLKRVTKKPTSIPLLYDQPFFNHFQIINNQVQYIGQNQWTQFIFNHIIPYNEEYWYEVKILRTFHRNIMIGVIDIDMQSYQRSSYKTNNAVCYYGGTGHKYPFGVQEGEGFTEGQVVEVIVKRKQKLIEWRVNGKIRASSIYDMLGVQERALMPYIQMHTHGDLVEWW